MPTALLRFPAPYRSATSFVTDIDATTFGSFQKVHGLFYGLADGAEDIALEMTNSFWMMAKTDLRQHADIYVLDREGKRDPAIGDAMGPLLASALFDTMHTYGSFKEGDFSRAQAEACLEQMARFGIAPPLWTYHGGKTERQNLGFGREDWPGDNPADPAYHLDLLADQVDLRFVRVWPSLLLEKPGVDIDVRAAADGRRMLVFKGHALLREPPIERVRAFIDLLREQDLTRMMDKRMYKPNPQYPDTLLTWTPELLQFQIADDILDRAVAQEKSLYLNQHLTRDHCLGSYQRPETIEALRGLSNRMRAGEMLVTSPSRLLSFETARDHMAWSERDEGAKRVIRIEPTLKVGEYSRDLGADWLEGIGFVTDSPDVTVTLGDRALAQFVTERRADGSFLTHWPWKTRIAEQRDALAAFAKAFPSA